MGKRILEIHVDEVSLVDDPAVGEDFVLVKNQNGKPVKKAEGDGTVVDPSAEGNTETEPTTGTDPAATGTTAGTPIHDALVSEILNAIAEAGKQIWASAPTLNINDDEAMKAFKEKIWAIEDMCWNLRNYRDVLSLAKAAKTKAEANDPTGAMDSVAKLLTKLASGPEVKKANEEAAATGTTKEGPLDQGAITRLAEGLQVVVEALQGMDAASISSMLQAFLGQGSTTDPEDEQGTKTPVEYGKNEKEKLATLQKELQVAKEKLAKHEENAAKRAKTIQSPNGLTPEIKTEKGSQSPKKPVVWEDDLASKK